MDAQAPLFSSKDVVVVADDEMFSRFVMAELLERLGGPCVKVARDGDEALLLLDGEGAPDIRLVLLDFQMPKRNGLEVLKQIRAGRLRVAHDIVVMVVTGLEGLGLVAGAMALDVDAFLPKPLTAAALREHLPNINDSARDIAAPHAEPSSGRVVAVSELAEGAVLVQDVLSPDGVLLVAAGTRVTSRTARLLCGLAAAGVSIGEIRVTEG